MATTYQIFADFPDHRVTARCIYSIFWNCLGVLKFDAVALQNTGVICLFEQNP